MAMGDPVCEVQSDKVQLLRRKAEPDESYSDARLSQTRVNSLPCDCLPFPVGCNHLHPIQRRHPGADVRGG